MEILMVSHRIPSNWSLNGEKIGQEEVIAESSCEEEFPELVTMIINKKIEYPLYLEDYYKIVW